MNEYDFIKYQTCFCSYNRLFLSIFRENCISIYCLSAWIIMIFYYNFWEIVRGSISRDFDLSRQCLSTAHFLYPLQTETLVCPLRCSFAILRDFYLRFAQNVRCRVGEMRERRSPRHSSSWNDISFPAVTHYAFLRDPKSGIKAGKRRKKKRRSVFSLTIAARATLPSVACAHFVPIARHLESFHPSLTLSQSSVSRFLYSITIYSARHFGRARSRKCRAREHSSRTDAVQLFFRRVHTSGGDRVVSLKDD